MHRFEKRPLILIVDDEPTNLKALKIILEDDYDLIFSTSGKQVISLTDKHHPDLILLDVLLGDSNGFDVCKQLKENSKTKKIPVIFVTILGDVAKEEEGFNVGAVDYISKPINAPIVKARVRTHLSLVQSTELRNSQLQMIRRLGRAAEFKDSDTSSHIVRVSHYAKLLATAYGCSDEWVNILYASAPMHDIGKIGIPDHILNKPGKLNTDEWEIMKKHSAIGAHIIGKHESPLLQMSGIIALEHHEKWDGSGYPKGISGEKISLEARIIAVADVFDALTSKRCYKDAWSVDDAFTLIEKEAGSHFEPSLARLFCKNRDAVIQVYLKYRDKNDGEG